LRDIPDPLRRLGAIGAGDQRREVLCAGLRRVIFLVAFDGRGQIAARIFQNLDCAIFAVAPEPNNRGNVETDLVERLRETVRGPELLLACDPAPRAEVNWRA
jgi:hypothetical protein